MSSILTRKDRAASPTPSSSLSAPVLSACVGVFGQSTELGQTTSDAAGAVPQLFASPDQGYFEPDSFSMGGFGSPFTVAAQQLADGGIKVKLINGAIGGISFITQGCGVLKAWQATTRYYGQRASEASGDPGYGGDVVFKTAGGHDRVFLCTSGARAFASINDPINPVTIDGVATNYLSSYSYETGGASAAKVSAAAEPAAFSTAVLNDVIADGGLTWKCVAYDSTDVGLDSGLRVLQPWQPGFDPFKIQKRLADEINKQPWTVGKKYVYIANGQSDAWTIWSWYREALRSICMYFISRGITPIVGLTIYNPGAGDGYNVLEQVVFGGAGDLASAQDPDNVQGQIQTLTYALQLPWTANPSKGIPALPSYGLPGTPGVAATGARPKQWYHGVSLYRTFGKLTHPNKFLINGSPHMQTLGAVQSGGVIANRLKAIIFDQPYAPYVLTA
jgi:hypothetical protein